MNILYPLSADPMTLGHVDIVNRIKKIYPTANIHVVIATNRDKNHFFTPEERLDIASKSVDGVNVILYDGILSDYINNNDIDILVRGIRNATDLDYEIGLEQFTRNTTDVETIYLTPKTEHLNTSSSLVRMLLKTGFHDKAQSFIAKNSHQVLWNIMNVKR